MFAAAGTAKGSVLVWECRESVLRHTLEPPAEYVRSHSHQRVSAIELSRFGTMLFTALQDGTVCWWDTARGKLISYVDIRFSFAFFAHSFFCDMWAPLHDWAILSTVLHQRMSAIELSRCGTMLFTALQDGTVCWWDTARGKLISYVDITFGFAFFAHSFFCGLRYMTGLSCHQFCINACR